jgi:hypothetical protein
MPARLSFRLEARADGQAVPFDAFAEMTLHISSMLSELDRSTTGDPSVRWLIRDLRVGSAVVALEAQPLNPLLDMSSRIVSQFTRGMALVATEQTRPEWFSEIAWEDARAIVDVLHDGVARIAISSDELDVELTDAIRLRVDEGDQELVETIANEEALTSIEGALDHVSGHDPKQLTFWLWDALHHRRVICQFSPDLEADVKHGLFERVRVHGLATFDRFGRPSRLRADSITVLSRDAKRPRAADLLGLVPNLTGNLPAEVWVRQMRDA